MSMGIFQEIAEGLDDEYELSIAVHPKVNVNAIATPLGPCTYLQTFLGDLPLVGPIIPRCIPSYEDTRKALQYARESIIQETDRLHRETPTPLDQVLEAQLMPDRKFALQALNFLTLGLVRRTEQQKLDKISRACLGWSILEHAIQVQAEATPEPAATHYRSLIGITSDTRQRFRRLANKWMRDENPLELPNPLEELAKYEQQIVHKAVGAEKWYGK